MCVCCVSVGSVQIKRVILQSGHQLALSNRRGSEERTFAAGVRSDTQLCSLVVLTWDVLPFGNEKETEEELGV